MYILLQMLLRNLLFDFVVFVFEGSYGRLTSLVYQYDKHIV